MTTPSLLTIFAHPDDEAFITGGTLALCQDRNIPAYAISATAGDAGRAGGLAGSPEELAAVRTREFASACAYFGVREHELFGYGDGRLTVAPYDEVVGRIVACIRRWRPSVAVTFGREGGSNAHRDHRAICRMATAAVLASSDKICYPEQIAEGFEPHTVSKFYHASAPADIQARGGEPFDRATTRVDVAGVVERKLEAFRLHETQAELLPRLEEWIAQNGEAEWFVRVLSRVPAPGGLEEDLFAGLV